MAAMTSQQNVLETTAALTIQISEFVKFQCNRKEETTGLKNSL